MLDKLIFLLALAGTAVVYADVLVRDGMLLAPVQRWLAKLYAKATFRARKVYPHRADCDMYYDGGDNLHEQWWWAPLWGCYRCVSGQWGFWGYLIRYHESYTWRTIPEHLAFTAFTIITAIIIQKWVQD